MDMRVVLRFIYAVGRSERNLLCAWTDQVVNWFCLDGLAQTICTHKNCYGFKVVIFFTSIGFKVDFLILHLSA